MTLRKEIAKAVAPPDAVCPRMTLRIALFTGNYDLVVDGVSLTLNRLVSFLRRAGHDVLVFAPAKDHSDPAQTEPLVRVSSVPILGREEYRLARPLRHRDRQALESFDPQIVHLATPDPLGACAMLWARARATPVVATYHTHFPAYLPYYHLGFLETAVQYYLRWFYNRCTEVYVPTPALVRRLRAIGVQSVLRPWGRGVDTNLFNPSRRSNLWRQLHGVSPDQVLVTFVGRLVREKGIRTFAQTLQRLQNRKLPVRGMIVGDGPMRSELERMLPECTFTGFLEGEELARAYASSDIFLYPSDSEAFGNVITEAMASGLPVVAAAFSGSSSHVVAERTGFLSEPRNVDDFVSRTVPLIQQPLLRERFGRAARSRASSYCWDSILSTMLTYYFAVLGDGTDVHDPATLGRRLADRRAREH